MKVISMDITFFYARSCYNSYMSDNKADIDTLIKQYRPRVFNIAYRILGNIHDAEDVVQETFIKANDKIDSFKNFSTIYTWIYRIAVNTSLSYRKNYSNLIQKSFDDTINRNNQPDPDFTGYGLSDVEKRIITDELLYEIREKCHFFVTFRLTEEQRIVFILREMFELSYSDIAFIIDSSEGVVKSRLSRARNNLRNHFQKNCSWYDSSNPCKCENKIGYLLSKYPGLLKTAQKNADNLKHHKMVKDALNDSKYSLQDIYRRIPMLEFSIKE